jgi:hypothetical protein
MPRSDHKERPSNDVDGIDFPRYGLSVPRAQALRYKLLGGLSPYYRGKAAMAGLPLPLAQALRRCVSSCDGRLLYVKNPKAACSSVTQLLHWQDCGHFVPLNQLHGAAGVRQGVRYAQAHLSSLNDPACVRFTVVRDPVARTVSAFMMYFAGAAANIFASAEHQADALVKEQGMWTLGYDPEGDIHRNFDIFLEYLAHSLAVAPAEVNIHWKPQTLSIARGLIDYAHIGRVETLDEDLRTIGELAGRDLRRGLAEMPHFNRSKPVRSGAFTATQAQRSKIRTLYAADYEAFGY